MKVAAIMSTSEPERIEKLGAYFRAFLQDWFTGIVAGVKFSEGVMRELTMALLEYAAAALIASSAAAAKEDDDATAERCKKAAREAMAVLEREVLS